MRDREPKTIGEILGQRPLPEIVVGMALHGNPGEAAVSCVFGTRKFGRKIGRVSSYEAAYFGVELALDHAVGGALKVVTCATNAKNPPGARDAKYGEIGSRIQSKLKATGSVIEFRRKRDDVRFDLANDFAKDVLISDDDVWNARDDDTRRAVEANIEAEAEGKLESPPESDIYRELRHYFPEPVLVNVDPENPWKKVPAFRGERGLLVPQLKVGGYRLDFGVIGPNLKLAIEVDGWTYHSSRESFEHDRRRDRRLSILGWRTFRYPASEAKYQPMQCADEIIDFLREAAGE
jgi:very-short-patch-repair endonuclease